MKWFTEVFLKSIIINNNKMKELKDNDYIIKTCIISEKQFSICDRYMNKIDNTSYTGYNGYHLEFFYEGWDITINKQPKGYGILSMCKCK